MIVDRTHQKWIIGGGVAGAIAAVPAALSASRSPRGLSGGSVVGLWLGIAGAALMVHAALLSTHRTRPGWVWLGRRQTWMRAHIWIPFLGTWLVVLHSGFRLGGGLERSLWVVLALTIATGLFGLALQHAIPRLITDRVPQEVPVGQHAHVCGGLRENVDELVAALFPAPAEGAPAGSEPDARRLFREDYARRGRAFFDVPYSPGLRGTGDPAFESKLDTLRRLPWSDKERESLDRLRGLIALRRQLAEQERLHGRLHRWLLFHIPLSVVLLVLALAHAITALYY